MAPVPFIGFDDIDSELSWIGVVEAIRSGHRLPRAVHDDVYLEHDGNGFFNRCALVPGLGLATKAVTIYPQNRSSDPPLPAIQGAVLLFDDATGKLLAQLDGELVTKWKTTGDSLLAATLLARSDAKKLVLVGAGTVGTYSLDAYCEAFPELEEILIWNRSTDAAERLAVANQHRQPWVTWCRDLAHAVADADIVSVATMSPHPVLKGDWINEGCHVDLIGAYRPDMREADDALLLKSKVFVDSRKSTINDIGEIAIPLSEGTITESHILGDYYDLCNRDKTERNAEDITLFKNGGGAHLDLMVSQHIYQSFMRKKI